MGIRIKVCFEYDEDSVFKPRFSIILARLPYPNDINQYKVMGEYLMERHGFKVRNWNEFDLHYQKEDRELNVVYIWKLRGIMLLKWTVKNNATLFDIWMGGELAMYLYPALDYAVTHGFDKLVAVLEKMLKYYLEAYLATTREWKYAQYLPEAIEKLKEKPRDEYRLF